MFQLWQTRISSAYTYSAKTASHQTADNCESIEFLFHQFCETVWKKWTLLGVILKNVYFSTPIDLFANDDNRHCVDPTYNTSVRMCDGL